MTINPQFSYIQLHRQGKVPTREWRQDSRILPADAREWVAQGYNLGVRTDRQSGVWVLDVDVNVETLEPSDEWKALVEANPLPDTFTVKSPSGGIHYYFRFPEIEVRNDQGKVIAPDVDIRGIGGYVVAPGMFASYDKHGKHFEGTYDVINDAPPAPTPEWILELLTEREEKAAEKKVLRDTGIVEEKVANPEPQWDKMARAELNNLFLMTEKLTALPEGESMEIFGEERGWERGSGFFVLACKIIEVARWPHTGVTVEQAHAAWLERTPPKYGRHDWENALDQAATTWEFGERRRNPVDLFEGVPYRGGVTASGDEPEALNLIDPTTLPVGWALGQVFAKAKDDGEDEATGGFKVEVARALVERQGPLAIDPSGSLWTYDHGVYVNNDKVVLDRLYHMMGDRFSSGTLTNVKLAVQATAPRLDLTRAPNPGLMNFTNGMLEWRSTDEVRPHRPDALMTTQFPYDWDASAECPRFDNWLETMLEPDQVALAWQILGYMMLSGNPLQVAFMLYGKGSNGKSTFAHVIEHLIGASNSSAVPLKDFNQRFSTSAMIGKVANIVGDIDFDYQVSTAALKQVTGADALQFERKNRDSFRATLWATCLFSANKIPGTNDGSEGYAERWVPLNFKRKASDHRIEGFSEEGLWEEIPGIAAKAVRALRELPLDKGSDRSAAFDLSSESSRQAVEDFREASNSYYSWVKNHTAPSETEVLKPKEIWAAYKLATGVRHGGTNCPPAFAEVLADRYGEPKSRRGMYLGVQRNVRGYAVAVLDDDEAGSLTEADIFGDVSASETETH